MKKRRAKEKREGLIVFTMVFGVILSGFSFMPIAGEETEGIKESSITVTTDKYTYCMGEPVHIIISSNIITGLWGGSSTELWRGYLIMDEFGNWVRDRSHLITCDIVIFEGPVNYTWYQKYELINECDLNGNNNIHYPNNDELVSPGKYYIYPCPGPLEPAEIEIIGGIPKPTALVTTDKYSFCIGEEVEITYKGVDSPYGPKAYKIYITNGLYLNSEVVFEFVPEYEPCVWMPQYGVARITWNQTYQVYDDFDYHLIVPPSGGQVSPGKYYAWYSDEDPAEFEIVECEPPKPIIIPVLQSISNQTLKIEMENETGYENDKEIYSNTAAPNARASTQNSVQVDVACLVIMTIFLFSMIITYFEERFKVL